MWDQGQKIGKSDTFMGLGIGKPKSMLVSRAFVDIRQGWGGADSKDKQIRVVFFRIIIPCIGVLWSGSKLK